MVDRFRSNIYQYVETVNRIIPLTEDVEGWIGLVKVLMNWIEFRVRLPKMAIIYRERYLRTR